MMRFCAVSSRSDRQCADANLVVLNVPFRWTRMTSSHSCSVMLKIIRSRRMPATLTSTSSRPNSSIAVPIRPSAAAKSEMSAPLATALPPASAISATVVVGGPGVLPGAVDCHAQVGDHHRGALAGQQQGHRPADPAPGAGDDRHPPVQSSHASSPFLPPPGRLKSNRILFWN